MNATQSISGPHLWADMGMLEEEAMIRDGMKMLDQMFPPAPIPFTAIFIGNPTQDGDLLK